MKLTQIPRRSSRIARHAVKQGARSAMTSQVAVEKSATEIKTTTSCKLSSSKATVLKGKKDVRNLQTLQKEFTNTTEGIQDTRSNHLCRSYTAKCHLLARTQIHT